MEELDKYLKAYVKQSQLVPRELAAELMDVVEVAIDVGLEQAVFRKLRGTDLPVAKYMRMLYDFLLYLDQGKVNKTLLLQEFQAVEAKFTALKELKDLVVKLFANQFPLKTIIQLLLEILPMIPIQSQPAHKNQNSNVTDIIAAKFGKSTKWLTQRLKQLNFTQEQVFATLNTSHNPEIKSIYLKDLQQQTIANDISHQSRQILSEQIWMYNSDKAGYWPGQLTNHLKNWNLKNPDLNLRQERLENLFLRVTDSLLYEEMRNGLSSEVTESIAKNMEFVKSVFINCLVLGEWITKRRLVWPRIVECFGLTDIDKEASWKTISLIVQATTLNMPESLKLFMFNYEHCLFVTKLKIKDYLRISRQYENNPDLPQLRKIMFKRSIDHIHLRILEFNKYYISGTGVSQQSLLAYELQILQSYEYNSYQPILQQVTIDQLLMCCIYSGLLLLTGRVAITFNEIISRYNKLIVKQDDVDKVAPGVNIIEFYNEYFLKEIADKDRIRSSINQITELPISEDFAHMLIHNDLVRQ